MEIEKVNIANKLSQFSDFWNPRIVGELNGQQVKLAKFKGDFVTHHHENEDELFLVISGKLFIELNHKTLKLVPGEFVVIPRGVPHKPYAPTETSVLLFEPSNTINTGEVENELTVKKLHNI